MAALPDLYAAESLQERLQGLVGDDVTLAVIHHPTDDDQECSPFLRHRQYRDGRLALGTVLTELGVTDDPLTVSMPHPRLSLSHSGDIAVAIGLRCAATAVGVGVDVEECRPIDVRSARFFLDDEEQDSWPEWAAQAAPGTDRNADRSADQSALQRLWTIKEAVFKSDLDNARRQLRDYRIDYCQPEPRHRFGPSRSTGGDPWVGEAHCGPATFQFRSVVVDGLILTIALRERTT